MYTVYIYIIYINTSLTVIGENPDLVQLLLNSLRCRWKEREREGGREREREREK